MQLHVSLSDLVEACTTNRLSYWIEGLYHSTGGGAIQESAWVDFIFSCTTEEGVTHSFTLTRHDDNPLLWKDVGDGLSVELLIKLRVPFTAS
jgi:hypothetical protein